MPDSHHLSRRDWIRTVGAASVGTVASLDALTAAGGRGGARAQPAQPIAVATRYATGDILELYSTSGVFIPPRGRSYMKFSFDFPEPAVVFGAHRFSFLVFTDENTLGLDRTRMTARGSADAMELTCDRFVWAGGQESTPGSLTARFRRDGSAIEWEVVAETTRPIKSVATVIRDVPRGQLSFGGGQLTDTHDGDALGGYTFGAGDLHNFDVTSMATPIAIVRASDQGFLSIASLDDRVRPKRFYFQAGEVAFRVEAVYEHDAWRNDTRVTVPAWRLAHATSIEAAMQPHMQHVEGAFGLEPWETRGDVQPWMRDVALVTTLHGMHYTGFMFNDYNQQLEILRWIATQIPASRVLVFLSAWDGRYYWDYPNYTVPARMGGEAGFRRLIADAQQLGFRMMPMFGANAANRRQPLWPRIADGATYKIDGDLYNLNWVDWNNDRHQDGWLTYMNLGADVWRNWLEGRIAETIERFGIDAYFLDIVGGHVNSTTGDMHAGTRRLVENLRARYPRVACVGEMPYDALHGFIPMYQAGGGGGRAGRSTRDSSSISARRRRDAAAAASTSGVSVPSTPRRLAFRSARSRRCRWWMIRSPGTETRWPRSSRARRRVRTSPDEQTAMRRTNRREFIQTSATIAAALALDPAASHALERHDARVVPSNERVKARRVPLTKVRLTGGPLQRAQEAAAAYLISLEPDRMLAFYRIRAGLSPKAEAYGGWDGPGRNLTGHVAGHYLSAVSLMHSATGDARFRDRATYIVRELSEVQAKHGDGYLSALEGARAAFAALSRGEIRSAAFDLNGLWSPWYTLHKTFAGLRDAYRCTGNADALRVETAFAGWVERVLVPLSDAQLARMLNTEFGGMNEVLTDLAIDTRDDRWLALSQKFEHHAFTDALERHQDNLAGKHSNCQIPKLIGSAARYEYAGDASDLVAAAFFWDRVAQHHSYATGGDGMAEYFGYPDQLSARVDGRTCESCCVYNMLKLTRRLFSFRPDVLYADFHERALFNHALASFDPATGRMSYMVPVGRAEQQEYQDMQHDFTCCVGTGMENHALHGDGSYYEADDAVWINLFAPSSAQLSDGTRLSMDTSFPDGDSATLTLTPPPAKQRSFTLHVRRPGWAGDGFRLLVNGEPVAVPPIESLRAGAAGGRDLGLADSTPPSSYVDVTRVWRAGDVVRVELPKSLHLEPTPDDRSVTAIMWGPLVLAGDLGPRRDGRGDHAGDGRQDEHGRPEAPALVSADKPLDAWIAPAGAPGDFRAAGVARSIQTKRALPDLSLTPFYRTHGRTYSVYFDVLTDSEFDVRVASTAAEHERLRHMEEGTLAFVQPGDAGVEQTFRYRSEPADRPVIRRERRPARGGAGWFSYDLPVDPHPNADVALVVTYLNDVGLPMLADFDILVDSTRVAHYQPNRVASSWWDASYDVPSALTRGKSSVTVRFQAGQESRIVPVYGVRVVRRS